MNRLTRAAGVAVVALAGFPAIASAHVTLQPNEVPAGEFKRLDVRVPTERDDASTVTFTTDGEGIRPGEFQDFGLSVGLPDTAGKTLTFKAVQRYSSGEVVRWIGPPDAEQPAAQVKLTAAADQESESGSNASAQPTPAAPATEGSDDEGGSDTLSVIALIVGVLGLLAGIAGLLVARRARAVTAM